MGNAETKQINFEVVQNYIQRLNIDTNILLINTLLSHEQDCVIYGTKTPQEEETLINDMLVNPLDPNTTMIIYGKNARDASISKKIEQLRTLGILGRIKVQIYTGGLFEWLLLQEVYGSDLFKTSGSNGMPDLLKYK
jgi:hypothetical protein